MTTNSDTPVQDRDDHRELHMVVLLLTMVVGLLIAGAAVYLARVHPSLAEPLGVGAAVLGALAGVAAIATRFMR
ncbi:hypothetical protein E3E14_28075 [Streptomyces sp. ICN441]|uniref:hypothetical protein n=1 Tax=Streptomyces sp. ICN441 TaxID=2558286 RepID=UPI00106A7A3B|nr:hypothetical protein [Streptomyces sp. ICN441]TFE38559.1 hypothetical protein E3E14_28075 [Streptomyces sp. ICN441]